MSVGQPHQHTHPKTQRAQTQLESRACPRGGGGEVVNRSNSSPLERAHARLLESLAHTVERAPHIHAHIKSDKIHHYYEHIKYIKIKYNLLSSCCSLRAIALFRSLSVHVIAASRSDGLLDYCPICSQRDQQGSASLSPCRSMLHISSNPSLALSPTHIRFGFALLFSVFMALWCAIIVLINSLLCLRSHLFSGTSFIPSHPGVLVPSFSHTHSQIPKNAHTHRLLWWAFRADITHFYEALRWSKSLACVFGCPLPVGGRCVVPTVAVSLARGNAM